MVCLKQTLLESTGCIYFVLNSLWL